MTSAFDLKRRGFLASLVAAGALAGCGFTLRRFDGMPFATIYLDSKASGRITERLRRSLTRGAGVRVVDTSDEADVVLTLANEEQRKSILSLSGAGRVKEYRFEYRLSYSLVSHGAVRGFAPEQIELSRDYTYDDAQALSKAAEEQMLYRDMENDAVDRILRRLNSLPRL